MTIRVVTLLFWSAVLGAAQNVDVGATIGIGALAAEHISVRSYVTLGVEVCALCSGRLGLFGEYNHWDQVGEVASYSGIRQADLIAGGLRIQGKRAVRPFLDVGLAVLSDEYDVFPGGRKSHSNAGFVLGSGVAIPIRGAWYLRPQGRLAVIGGGPHLAASFSVGIGYRFGGR